MITTWRAEPGDIVDNLPPGSIRHELAAHHIEPVEGHPGFYRALTGLDYPATNAPTPLPKAVTKPTPSTPGPQPDDKPAPVPPEPEATP